MRKYFTICLILFSVSFLKLFSQTKTISRSNQQWLHYFLEAKLGEKWSLMPDAGYRWSASFSSRLLYVTRLSLGYKINSQLRIAGGITHIGAFSGTRLARLELRPYQELRISHQYAHLKTSHRFRIEQRFFQSMLNGKLTDIHNFNHRFRYQFGLQIPLAVFPRRSPESSLSLTLSEEIFINAGKEIVYNIFDQNRLSAGPVLRLNDHFSWRVLYGMNFSALNVPATYKWTNIFLLAVAHNLEISEK